MRSELRVGWQRGGAGVSGLMCLSGFLGGRSKRTRQGERRRGWVVECACAQRAGYYRSNLEQVIPSSNLWLLSKQRTGIIDRV